MATNKQIEEAWNNAHKMRGKNPDVYRKDDYGNVMYYKSQYQNYQKRENKFYQFREYYFDC